MQNKRLILILAAVPILLLLPLIAMQFSNEVDWRIQDFAIMGVLLLCSGLLCDLILRKIKRRKGKIILCAIVLIVFLLLWAELAVGIIGSSIAGS